MTLPIDSRDVDGNGFCKASSLLGHIQEAAAQAAERGGFGRDMTLNGYRAFWMLTRVWYRLRRPLGWEEPLTIRTWHRGDKGATMYRDYDLFVRGEQVGECVSAWVLASLDSRQLIRLGTVRELDGTSGGELCKTMTLAKLRQPDILREAEQRRMRYSDSDLNGHVNNTRYADFACDALEMEKLGPGRFLSEMQIGYLAECRVWSRALSQTEIANNMNYVDPASEGLVAYWRMNEWEPNTNGSGNIVPDLTGHGYDAVGGSDNPTMMDTRWL